MKKLFKKLEKFKELMAYRKWQRNATLEEQKEFRNAVLYAKDKI